MEQIEDKPKMSGSKGGRPKGRAETAYAAFRIPVAISLLWEDTANKLHLNKTSTLIVAIKELADKHGVKEREAEATE